MRSLYNWIFKPELDSRVEAAILVMVDRNSKVAASENLTFLISHGDGVKRRTERSRVPLSLPEYT